MRVGEQVLIRATVYDTPDAEADNPRDRFYTFQVDTGSREAGALCDQTEIVSIYECVVRDRVVADPTGNLPVGSVVAKGNDVWVLRHPRTAKWYSTSGATKGDSHINEWLKEGSATIMRVGP